MEVFSDSRVHSYSIQFSCVLFMFDNINIRVKCFTTSFRFLLFALLFQSHDCPDIEGTLPKGPYPPCLRMADRPFWQDTLDIWLAQLQWRTLTVHGYNYPVSNHSGTRQKSIQIIVQIRIYHGRLYCTKKIDEPGKGAHEIRWELLFADFIIMISCLV